MPVYKGPGGKAIKPNQPKRERTRLVNQDTGGSPRAVTERIPGPLDARGPAAAPPRGGKAERTRLHLGGKADKGGDGEPATGPFDAIDDPVVGWVVIAGGPGKGRALALSAGKNDVGRGADQRISLAFGDDAVSEKRHCVITYDPENRRFFLQDGAGRNLTYLAGEPVMSPVELKGGEAIRLGATTLRFVPLCGDEFDWAETE